MISVSSILRNLAAVTLLLATTWSPALAADASLDEAIRLYEAARYAEALPLLEKAVAAGDADGVMHYRLYFCRRSVGAPNQREALEAARALLEEEVKTANGFESAFYLASSYTNLGQTDQLARSAAEVTARFESGKIPAPKTPVEQFRLGKLYADQNRELEADPWLSKAVDGFAADGDASHRAYLEWAARRLGQRAMADERYEFAAKQYAHVQAAGNPTIEDLDNLGKASLMIGQYDQAGEAWRAGVRMSPASADSYRYGAGLARLAAQVDELPISPDGERSWEEVGREELENLMREQSQKVRETRAEIEAAGALTGRQRKAFSARLVEPRPLFTAAALEYKRRGLSLREAAFFGGYAPLIFRAREWEIASPPRKRWTPALHEAALEERRKRAAEREAAGAEKNQQAAEGEED